MVNGKANETMPWQDVILKVTPIIATTHTDYDKQRCAQNEIHYLRLLATKEPTCKLYTKLLDVVKTTDNKHVLKRVKQMCLNIFINFLIFPTNVVRRWLNVNSPWLSV